MAKAVAIPVAESTQEWEWIEYFLSVSCRSSLVHSRSVWNLEIPQLRQAFERRSRGLLVLPCLVPISALGELNTVQEVCQRGFKLGPDGICVSVGNFTPPGMFADVDEQPVDGDDAEANSKARYISASRRLYEVFLCHVCVGRSFLHDCGRAKSVEDLVVSKLFQDLPPEYDSIYLHFSKNPKKFQDPNGNAVAPQHTFQHDYIIRDAGQIIPLYLVHFEFDSTKKDKLWMPLCDSCTSQPAAVWCEADNAKLCETCDQDLHSLNAIVARHIRVPIYEMPRVAGDCAYHNQEVLQYCATCKMMLCKICLSTGTHSSPEIQASHEIMPIQEAYRTSLRAHRTADQRLLERQEQIKHSLTEVEDLLRTVQENGKIAEERLYILAQECIEKSQEITEDYVQKLVASEVDIKRELALLDWSSSFIKKQMLGLPPADFLNAWSRHCAVRQLLLDNYEAAESVFLENVDLQVEGGMHVSTLTKVSGQ